MPHVRLDPRLATGRIFDLAARYDHEATQSTNMGRTADVDPPAGACLVVGLFAAALIMVSAMAQAQERGRRRSPPMSRDFSPASATGLTGKPKISVRHSRTPARTSRTSVMKPASPPRQPSKAPRTRPARLRAFPPPASSAATKNAATRRTARPTASPPPPPCARPKAFERQEHGHDHRRCLPGRRSICPAATAGPAATPKPSSPARSANSIACRDRDAAHTLVSAPRLCFRFR